MLETVERESPVARAISARLARPRSRSALMTRPRFSSLSERSDPESDDSTAPDPYRPGSVCQEYGVTPSKRLNNCQDSGQSQTSGRVLDAFSRHIDENASSVPWSGRHAYVLYRRVEEAGEGDLQPSARRHPRNGLGNGPGPARLARPGPAGG